MDDLLPLRDGEDLPLEVAGGQWLATWHAPGAAPEGQQHGACGVCVAEGGQVVLISADGLSWDFPAGRSEDGESWEETLRREVQEEACATVVQARLLGFARSRCLSGPQAHQDQARLFWRAEVEAWQPQFEIARRRLVEPGALAPLSAHAMLRLYRSPKNGRKKFPGGATAPPNLPATLK